MIRIISIAGAILLYFGVTSVAMASDDLDIKLVVDKPNETLLKQTKIIGCNDHAKKKEMSCAKEPEEIILSKLPTSSQLDNTDFNTDRDIENLKKQLKEVMEELAKLKKDREHDKKIIEKLSSLIEVISKEKSVQKKKMTVKKGIANIVKKNIKKRRVKYIPKKIKILEQYDDHLVIEVQAGESLSSYAEAFYNNRNLYYRIYKANKDKINKNLDVMIGDHLIIPLDKPLENLDQ